jgi:type IX secretion system PorP/SprF family membrane protein
MLAQNKPLMKKLIYTLVACFTISSSAMAIGQGGATDPHFSQFYAAPMLLNPAMTGAFSCNYRFTAIFRGQWGSILKDESVSMFRTPSASVDFRTNKGFGRGDAFGFGAYFLNDAAGQSRFQTNRFGLSIAYHKSLDRRNEHFLSLGFTTALWQRSIDMSGLQFGNQNDNGLFNPLKPNNEYIVNNNFLFWDISVGLMYTGRFGRRARASGYIGVAADHLNTPNESFLGDKSVRLPMKLTVHGGYRFPIKGRFDGQPKFIYMNQGVSHELNLGADLRIVFEEREREGNNFKFGAMFRLVGGDKAAAWHDARLNGEAVILNAGVEWNHINFSAAYDINVSQLVKGSQSQGAFELAASYVGCFAKRRPATMFCPKF